MVITSTPKYIRGNLYMLCIPDPQCILKDTVLNRFLYLEPDISCTIALSGMLGLNQRCSRITSCQECEFKVNVREQSSRFLKTVFIILE